MKFKTKLLALSLTVGVILSSIAFNSNSNATHVSENATTDNNQSEIIGIDDIDVVQTLSNQIEEYETMLDGSERDEQIQGLIDKTNNLIEEYEALEITGTSKTNEPNTEINLGVVGVIVIAATNPYAAVIETIAAFSANQWKLSAELLTEAYGNTDSTKTYAPIYGGRVISSNTTKEIANLTTLTGSRIFEYTSGQSNNNTDLALAIHEFSYVKQTSESKIINIIDKYNFDVKNFSNNIIQFGNDVFNKIESLGIIGAYNVSITIDTSKDLDIKINSKTNSTWEVQISNNTAVAKTIVYNQKMCNEDDAREWRNLSDIAYCTLSGGKSTYLYISENGSADNIAISFLDGDYRYVSFAYGIKVGGELSKELSKVSRHKYSNIEIIGKNDSTWYIQVNNTYGAYGSFEYNSKMCFASAAQNWTGLSDVKTRSIVKDGSAIISISENGLAGYIAIRFKINSTYYYIYANKLNADTTMTVNRKTESVK